MSKRCTTEEFIEKARKVHGNRYDYSKVVYTKSINKICIICKEHGEFIQTAKDHLSGAGCGSCGKIKCHQNHNITVTTKDFIQRSLLKHGNKYDYSKTNYVNQYTEVEIVCPVHGLFLQQPKLHLRGHGCPKCGLIKQTENIKLTHEEFIKRSISKHGYKYDYSITKYIKQYQKVKIICPVHGVFEQRPKDHMNGFGCDKCGGTYKMDTEMYIEKANKKHNFQYDYSKTEYIDNDHKIIVICPIHGEYHVSPTSHLYGCKCLKCVYEKMVIIKDLPRNNLLDVL